MAYQLIYTSSPRGLTSGRTGFVTVARHREVAVRLVPELEKESGYEWLTGSEEQPVVRRYSLYGSGSTSVRVLTRILPSGLDFTHRPCHLAHHVIVPRSEPVMGNPLDWLKGWSGFREEWKEEPQWLEDSALVTMANPAFSVGVSSDLPGGIPGSRDFWKVLPTSARARPVFLYEPGQEKLLFGIWQWLLAQVSLARQWEITFTTFLQSSELADRYTWCAGWPGSAAAALAKREPHRLIDLTSNSLAESLQRLVLNGDDSLVATPRRYVSAIHSDDKPVIVRPVGNVARDNRKTLVVEEKESNPRTYAAAIWVISVVGALAILLGVWWLPGSDKSEQPIPPTYVVEHEEVMSWQVFPDPKVNSSTAQDTEIRNREKQWQEVTATDSVVAVRRFMESLRGNSEDVEKWRGQAEEWLQERDKIRLRVSQQIVDLGRLEFEWDESRWNQGLASLPVEWRKEMEEQRQIWEQVRQWLQNMPTAPLFLLTGKEDRWVLPFHKVLANMADTSWSAVSASPESEAAVQKELPLQLLQIDSQYRVVYDIFSVLRIQPYGNTRQQWEVRMDTVPAEALRQHPNLFILQQAPVFRVLDGQRKALLTLRRMPPGHQWPDSVQTLSARAAVKENDQGDVQLAAWLSEMLERVHWVSGGESPDRGHWVWENSRDEWLVGHQTADNIVLSRTKTTPVGNKSSSGVSISNGQLRTVKVDWVLKNGPWKIRWSTSLPGEETVLLILE